jgi:hypothetical protein
MFLASSAIADNSGSSLPTCDPVSTETKIIWQVDPVRSRRIAKKVTPDDLVAQWDGCNGTHTFADGTTYSGVWRDGKPSPVSTEGVSQLLAGNGRPDVPGSDSGQLVVGRSESDQINLKRQADEKEQARVRAERAETERLAAQKRDAEQREQDRLAAQRRESERLAAQRREAEQREQERLAAQRRETERLAAQKRDAEQKEQDRLAAQRRESERLAAQKREAEQREQERVAAQSREKERLNSETLVAERERQSRESVAMVGGTASSAASFESSVQRSPGVESAVTKRSALIIGNGTYSDVPTLKNATADAKSIAKALQKIGFEVLLRLDQDDRGMRQSVREWVRGLPGGSEAVFFFAGHGVQLGSANYLLPVNISGEDEDQVRDDGLALQRVLDDLSSQRVRISLAIIDACRDNPFKNRLTGRSIGATRGLAPTTAATGQMILFSAGTGQSALDSLGPRDPDPNGVFTRVLLKQLTTPGVPVDQVLKRTRVEVVSLASKVGHEQVPALYDQTIGDYFLVR